MREIGEHRLALGVALLRVDPAEKGFRAGFVQIVAKVKSARSAARQPALAAADRPSRDDLREAGDVLLGVPAIDSERVQLEDFPCQIFIDPERALGVALRGEARRLRSLRPTENWLSRNAIIAGCFSTAVSSSTNRPLTCGRIASFSSVPANPKIAPLSEETAK